MAVGRLGLGLAAIVLLGACGRHAAEPPAPGTSSGLAPDLRGRRVMVLPVQVSVQGGGDADAELAFALTALGSGMDWIWPRDLDRALSRSPGLRARTTGLPVEIFLQAEVRRVGDPLYGDLRRLAALVDADVALLPVRLAPGVTDDTGTRLELTAALVMVRSGRVLWFGVVEGEPGAPGDPRALASTMERLARTLLWYAGA